MDMRVFHNQDGSMSKLPPTVNILGITYTIHYVDKPSDVDHEGIQSMWGEVNYWQHSIRIYNGRGWWEPSDVLQSVIHEILHVIAESLRIGELRADDGKHNEDNIDRLAVGLADVLTRNGWLTISDTA